jgi:hypothetical protein
MPRSVLIITADTSSLLTGEPSDLIMASATVRMSPMTP